MRPITTYFPKEPKRTKETQKNRKDQIVSEKCSSHRVEIIQIDDDSDSSHQQTENAPRENHVDKEEKYSIIHDLFSLDADFYEEDGNCGFEKRGTPWMTAEVADADNTDVSVTQGCQQKKGHAIICIQYRSWRDTGLSCETDYAIIYIQEKETEKELHT